MMGIGTFVASTKTPSPLFEVKNIADEIQERGHRHRTEVIFVREEETDHSQAFSGMPSGPESSTPFSCTTRTTSRSRWRIAW